MSFRCATTWRSVDGGRGARVLVFTRRQDEAIVIGDGIQVRVLRIGREGVRLGVVAPRSVAVHRREVYDQIRRQNEAAATATADLRALATRLRGAGHRPPATDPPAPARPALPPSVPREAKP